VNNIENMTNAEKEVAEFLDKLYIWKKYEFPLYLLDDDDRPRLWSPDFWLPKLGIYVEVCGTEDINYDYREEVYDKNGFKVIFVHYYKEPEMWRKFLVDRITDIQFSRVQEVKIMNERFERIYA